MAVAQRLYARALFEAAKDQDRTAIVGDQLRELATALAETPELEAFLTNPQLDPRAKASLLEEIATGADPLVQNFLKLAAEKGRGGDLRDIAAEFEQLVDREQGRITVELTTAHELSDTDAAAIVSQIEKSSGRSVEASRSVDPSLIGGLILQAGTLRVDASVRGRLEKLRRELVTKS
ncbi:MAG: ATP synthase F1 subunit delta [Gaiellales bacterium]